MSISIDVRDRLLQRTNSAGFRKKFMQYLPLHGTLEHAISLLGKSIGVGTGTSIIVLTTGTSA